MTIWPSLTSRFRKYCLEPMLLYHHVVATHLIPHTGGGGFQPEVMLSSALWVYLILAVLFNSVRSGCIPLPFGWGFYYSHARLIRITQLFAVSNCRGYWCTPLLSLADSVNDFPAASETLTTRYSNSISIPWLISIPMISSSLKLLLPN